MRSESKFMVVLTVNNCTETFDYDSFESAKSAALDLSKAHDTNCCYVEKYNPVSDEYEECFCVPNKFDSVTGEARENLLMETAMIIMEIYRDMLNRGDISSEMWETKFCTGELDSIALLQLFRDWAREFENTYYNTDDYNDDYIGLIDWFASAKLNEIFTENPVYDKLVEAYKM